MDKTVLSSWRSHDNDRIVHAAIIHVAVADVDAAYGAYAAAENIPMMVIIMLIMRSITIVNRGS